MAQAASTLDLPFHADLRVVAECGRHFFSALTRKRIRRGSFHSIVDPPAATNRHLAEHNAEPRPFVRKASAASILAKLDRLPALFQ